MNDQGDDASSPRSQLSDTLEQMWLRSLGTISLWVAATCVVVFLSVGLLDRLGIVARQQVVSALGLSFAGVFVQFRFYQFATSPFFHANVTHLLFNMLSLWILGPEVEAALGRRRYVTMSILCAACGMAGFLLLGGTQGNVVIGYSAVVFGILVAQAILFPNHAIVLFALFPLKMKHAVLLLGAVELYLTIAPEDNGIAHASHVFGALGAVVWFKGRTWLQAIPRRMTTPRTKMPRPRSVRPQGQREIPKEL